MPTFKAFTHDEKCKLETSGTGLSNNEYYGHDTTSTLVSSSQKRIMSMKELLGLFAMSFSYALCFNTLGTIVIPKTIDRLAVNMQSIWVGSLMALGAVCQLTTPLVGAYSDRIGSRLIFLIYGSLITIVGILLFIVMEITEWLLMLCIAHVVTTVGLSIVYSMTTALLNDYVPDEETGKGSGVIAVLALLGSGTGYIMFALDVPVTYCLCSYILAVVFCLVVSVSFIPNAEPHRPVQQPVRIVEIVATALTVPPFRLFPDFSFACLGRALFNCGLAGQVYLVFYLRDVFDAASPVRITSALSIAALVGGVLGAIPSGMFSDSIGRKPVIYIAVLVCTISLLLLLMVRHMTLLYLVGLLHGFGNASYLSVDYALGVATLPRKGNIPIDAAKDLGIFAMSATIGMLFGQVIYGGVLHAFVTYTESGALRYSSLGFVVVYSISCVAFVFSGITTAFIRAR